MQPQATIAIIGGSGLTQIDGLKIIEELDIDTPFGHPSDKITLAEIEGRRVAFLPRHGKGHRINPSNVPYRANIWALKSIGVLWIITFSAVGSLRIDFEPRHFCVPDQIIDRTTRRINTFYDDLVVHIPFGHPFNEQLCQILIKACRAEGVTTHDKGTYLSMEGPAFSTRAESLMYRTLGADIVGMTAIPEARLAAEAEMAYATVAQITDYDSWHETIVTLDEVLANMSANVANVHRVIKRVIPMIPAVLDDPISSILATSITTDPRCIGPEFKQKYDLLLGKYLDFSGGRK